MASPAEGKIKPEPPPHPFTFPYLQSAFAIIPMAAFCRKLQKRYGFCGGGKGGFGNTYFKNSRNQAPTKATQGHPGESKTLILSMKWKSDVGFIGFRSTGKTTFLQELLCQGKKTPVSPSPAPRRFFIPPSPPADQPSTWVDLPGFNEHHLFFLRQVERSRRLVFFSVSPVGTPSPSAISVSEKVACPL